LVGEPDANAPAKLTIVVRRRASDPASAGPGAQLTREQFAQQYGADPADLKKVEDYAASQGLSVDSSDAARRAVEVSGTLAQVQAAFDANVGLYRQGGQTFRARTGELTIPAELQGIVVGVFGFDERQQAHSRLRRLPVDAGGTIRPRASAANTSYSPLDLAALYNFPAGNAAGQTIGIIELGGGYSDTDLSTYFSGLNVSPAPRVISVSVDGGSNSPSGDPNSADGEVELDIQVSGAIASGATIAVYFAPNTTMGFLDAITTAIHDSTNNPSVISISWGGPEDSYTSQALTSYDQAFQDAMALGVTVCIASGDNGSTDGETDGNSHVDFPASSPHVLACGGTNLQSSSGSITSETVWNGGANGGASGGGVSETFPLPSFQANAGVPVSVNSSQFVGRGVPDVCGDADPATGYNVLVDGSPIVVGGTSAVAPLWAALIAVINAQVGKSAGFVNPILYATPAALNDITQGNNGAYSAGPGWDACTGLGSPNGMAVMQALQAAASPAPVPGTTTPPPASPGPSAPVS
jgi:kumamolisin